MKKIAFLPKAFDDFQKWSSDNQKIYNKIVQLIKEISRDPKIGTGKPEALKHELSGLWSRRITEEHRLVYKFDEEEVIIVSCRFHYK